MTVKGANRSTCRKKCPIATSSLKNQRILAWVEPRPPTVYILSWSYISRGHLWWFLLMVYICPCRWNYDLKCCSVGVTEGGLRRLEEPEQMLQEEEGSWSLCLKRVFFLGDSCRLTARDAMWETILSVWVDVEFRDPPAESSGCCRISPGL
jgi:hypothetical protein